MVGTLRANRRGNPKIVVEKKLKKGDIVSRQNDEGILVLKWKDKRDLIMISSKNDDSVVEVQKRDGTVVKPRVVLDYNKGKSFIDRSDQMTSYCIPLRRSIKWYRKIAIDLLLSVGVVNALSLYQTVCNRKVSVTDFKESIMKSLMLKNENINEVPFEHNLVYAKQSRCTFCYKDILSSQGYKEAQKRSPKPTWKCTGCDASMCITCFSKVHISKLT